MLSIKSKHLTENFAPIAVLVLAAVAVLFTFSPALKVLIFPYSVPMTWHGHCLSEHCYINSGSWDAFYGKFFALISLLFPSVLASCFKTKIWRACGAIVASIICIFLVSRIPLKAIEGCYDFCGVEFAFPYGVSVITIIITVILIIVEANRQMKPS